MQNDFDNLTIQFKEGQLSKTNESQEKNLINVKFESLVSEIDSEKTKSYEKQKEMDNLYAKTKTEIENLKSKLINAETGLQELGKENQALQVELVQVSGKKWVNDVEVEHCEACSARFGLTVRKHHCRKCGQIFCKDCSNKQAAVPEFKKLQRVCNRCFSELEKMAATILS